MCTFNDLSKDSKWNAECERAQIWEAECWAEP